VQNLSNLPAKFAFSEPKLEGDPSTSAYDVRFSPSKGSLTEKECKDITMTFIAKRPGRVDALFACDIDGMPFPLGFTLASLAKGLVVTYELIPDEVEEKIAQSRVPKVEVMELEDDSDDDLDGLTEEEIAAKKEAKRKAKEEADAKKEAENLLQPQI
jgi:hypothetical protein